MSLQSLSISNFKCFSSIELELRPLTVFTGINAGGKSSSIQPLLLMSQALRRGPSFKSLALNGARVKLGEARDIINWETDDSFIKIGFEGFSEKIDWQFSYQKSPDRRGMMLNGLNWESEKKNNNSLRQIWPYNADKSELLKTIRDAIYISASRKTNLDNFPLPSEAILPKSDVGIYGEYAPYWHSELADEEVDSERRYPDDERDTVRAQLDNWLSELFPGASANSIRHNESSSAILQFRLGRAGSWSRPENVGYGLSYIFPILVSLLTAKKGSVILIDSPEAHLHPRAQSLMGKMLSRFANAGLQIFVETHSDHLLSGIRLATKDKLIDHEKVQLYFFGPKSSEGAHGVVAPSLDINGQIDNWPKGFFDQSELDLMNLAGWSE